MLSTFLAQTKNLMMKPHIVCGDGFTFSCQNYSGFYCDKDSVEIGALSKKEPLLKEFLYDPGIFGYVPFAIVDKIIAKHKGIDYRRTFGGNIAPFRICEYCNSSVSEYENCPHCGAPPN